MQNTDKNFFKSCINDTLVGRFIIVKLSNLHQMIYDYNEISSKILQDFCRQSQTYSKIYVISKGTKITKTFWKKKEMGVITLLYLRTHLCSCHNLDCSIGRGVDMQINGREWKAQKHSQPTALEGCCFSNLFFSWERRWLEQTLKGCFFHPEAWLSQPGHSVAWKFYRWTEVHSIQLKKN